MKHALQTVLASAPVVFLSSCGNLAPPNSQSFDPSLDPLDSPGSRKQSSQVVSTGPRYAPGSYVEVSDTNAGFYRRVPRGSEQADSRLAVGTPLKVVTTDGSYLRVETESGQIGYVPAIMVTNKRVDANLPIIPVDEAGVPPAPASAPASIEPVDPSGLEPLPPVPPSFPTLPTPGADDAPFIAPEPEVPPISVEEALPPSAPSVSDEVDGSE